MKAINMKAASQNKEINEIISIKINNNNNINNNNIM